jgi:hypothetical protein
LPEKKDYLKNVFEEIGLYQKSKNTSVVIPIFPLIYEFDRYKWEDINTLIISICNENGLRYLSLLDDYRIFPYNEMRVQCGDFTHPSIKRNTVAADAILQFLVKNCLLWKGYKGYP